MHVGARPACKALKEIRHQFRLQIADQPRAYLGVHGEGRAPAQVNSRNRQRLIHRHEKVTGAQDAALVAQRAVKALAQRDAHIFDRVVLIDIQIALALQIQIECAVAREEFQHVIEEADAGEDFIMPAALNRQLDRNLRFGGVAFKA